MGKLKVLSGEEVCKILESQDFSKVSQRGSHAVMQKATHNSSITVPVPLHSEVRQGTLLSIIRISSLPRVLFEIQN